MPAVTGASPSEATTRVLIWTEAHVVGGSDRFLIDLVRGLDGHPYSVAFAGIAHAGYDEWLRAELPHVPRRVTIPIASLPGSPLARIRARLGGDDAPPAELSAAGAGVALPVSVAVAGLRYRHAATNVIRLRRMLRSARPDVLFINNGGYPGGESCRYAALAARHEGVPRTVHMVHNMAYPPNWPPAVERAIDRRVDAAVDAWATSAKRASAALDEVRGMTAAKVHTVPIGIPPAAEVPPASAEELGYEADALNVACVAAFEPRKGHLVLLDALRTATDSGVRIRCALVGTGADEARVRRRVSELGLDDQVRFAGWREDVAAILRASDVLVLPSLSNECFPNAILEAMAHGLPAIGTDVAGIPDQIDDGVTGRVVPPGDPVALAAAFGELAGDGENRRAMGEAGRRRMRSEFTVERMVESVTALWRG